MRPVPLQVGRYELCAQTGAGGMATVHLGKLRGARRPSRSHGIKNVGVITADRHCQLKLRI